jgi:hypothetical protein
MNYLHMDCFLGQATKGYKGYPTYEPNMTNHHSKRLGKTNYIHHSRWLKSNHPYQANARDLNGKSEEGPPHLSFQELMSYHMSISMKIGNYNMLKRRTTLAMTIE